MKQVLLENFSTRDSDDPLWPYFNHKPISKKQTMGLTAIRFKTTNAEQVSPVVIQVPNQLGTGRIDGATGQYKLNCERVNLYITREVEETTGIGRVIFGQGQFIMEQHDAIIQMDQVIIAHEKTIKSMQEYVDKWRNTTWWQLIIMGLTKWM